jgi:hypothetical protein
LATKTIHTANPSNQTLNKNQDTLEIDFNSTCNWCYDDPQYVFGNPSVLPAAGLYNQASPPYKTGQLTPVADGTVLFNAVPSDQTCTTAGITATGHTIVVSGS